MKKKDDWQLAPHKKTEYYPYKTEQYKTKQFQDTKPLNPFEILNPFLNSWTIGLDRHFQLLEELRNAPKQSYPPYNIVRVDDDETYIIEIAAAGFSKKDIQINLKENQLTVSGSQDGDGADYLHKGIAARNFEQNFVLADDVKVIDASMKDGILSIRLEREIPEHKKPRTIDIK